MKEAKGLLLNNREVVVLSDIKQIFKETECQTVAELKLEMFQMMQETSFSLDYELPLNKRFVKHFTKLVERRGFVTSNSLPQSNVTIFRKSQPYLVFYKSRGEYEKSNKIMGAGISSDTSVNTCDTCWTLAGATMELKRSIVHLKVNRSHLHSLVQIW